MDCEPLLWTARWVHIGSCLVLAGSTLFPLYAGRAPDRAERLFAPLALAALGSGLVWAALVTNTALDGDLSPDGATAVLLQTGFGRVWCLRLALGVALPASAAVERARPLRPWLAAALLASLAGLGHAVVTPGLPGALRVAARAAHLLAAGLWLGGLFPLAERLARAGVDAAPAVRRFSKVAVWAVGAVLLTGGAEIVFAANGKLNPAWFGLLAFKVLLVGSALALALANRMLFAPRLGAEGAEVALRSLRQAVLAEQLLLAAAVAVVAVLGAISPTLAMSMAAG